jgi:phosphoglucosamine mutase
MGTKYFGTDGVRGVANETLTAAMAYRIGRYLGQYPAGKKNKVLLCRDTRLSGEMLKSALLAGLLSSGAEVYDEGVSTTPSISYLVVKKHFDFGVMISASHNPFYDNGIKVFNHLGEKLENEIENKIEEYMDRPQDDLPCPSKEDVGHLYDGDSLKQDYIHWLSKKATSDYSSLKVLVDCANGSASYVAPFLYQKIGLNATFINASPNGININAGCGSTHMEALSAAFHKGHYDLAFAFDGDSDRFMALAPDGRLIDGDAMIYLNALSLKKAGKLHSNTVVITVMSNFGLRKVLEDKGIGYDTVAVGDKNVQARLKEKDLSIGGEQSGHVIFLEDLNTGDGLLSSIKLLNLFVKEKAIFKELGDFVVYPQVLKNVNFASRDILEKTASSASLKAEIASEEKALGNHGRILVRPSGTEPLLRVMAEADTQKRCQDIVDHLVHFIEEGQ